MKASLGRVGRFCFSALCAISSGILGEGGNARMWQRG